MKQLSNKLLILLAAQLLLLVWVFWPHAEQGSADARMALLNIQTASISKVVISDTETSIVLSKGSQGWHIPEYHNLPVDPAKLDRLIDVLPALPRGFVTAQTSGAKQRFEVAEDSFQRRVQYADDSATQAEIYLGTSPGFRKVHARVGGEDRVYGVEFNTFDLPASPSDWLDQTLLQIEDVQAIQGLDYQVSWQDDSWQNKSAQHATQADIDGLVNGLHSLRISGATDLATAKILRETVVPPTLVVTAAGASYEYRLYEIEEAYYINRSDIPIYFTVSAFDYDRLNDVSAETLFKVEDEADAQAEAEDLELEANMDSPQ